jgi:hypothetical protein
MRAKAKDFINMWAEKTRRIYGESYDATWSSYATCSEDEEKKEQEKEQETTDPESPAEVKPDESHSEDETDPG